MISSGADGEFALKIMNTPVADMQGARPVLVVDMQPNVRLLVRLAQQVERDYPSGMTDHRWEVF